MLNIDKFFKQNMRLTPLLHKSKLPLLEKWNTTTISIGEFQAYGPFPEMHNIGLLTGKQSDGIIDIDLDHALAGSFGRLLLPETDMIFGRNSKPASHYLYKVRGSGRTRQFKHPAGGGMLAEVRGDGSQTMFPGSIHPSGEDVRFEDGLDREPGTATYDELLTSVSRVAACCVVAEQWKEGSRHSLSLAFAGVCATSGVPEAECARMVLAICDTCSDDETEDRIACVRTTYDQMEAGGAVAAIRALIEHIGDRSATMIRQWLGGSSLPTTTSNQPTGQVTKFDPGTDISIGQAFCDSMNGSIIYSDREDMFYQREVDLYKVTTVARIKSQIVDYLNGRKTDISTYGDLSTMKSNQSVKRINSVLEISKTRLIADSSEFDTDNFLAGTRNGVLDLRACELIDPNIVITKRLGTIYDPGAYCHNFKQYLNDIFDGDNEKVEFLRRAVGYTLTGSTEGQCMFVLTGRGANGKSTLLKVVRALMGDYAGSIMFQSLIVGKYVNKVNDDLASLKGVRFVSTQEGEAGQRLAVSRIKEMTGGDAIQCRNLYEKFFLLEPEFKIWMSTNELPEIPGGDDAIWRRLHIIDFPRVFQPHEQDPQLFQKLTLELPGILNWALEGLKQIGGIKADFLNVPDSIKATTQRYRDENDTVKRFVEEACQLAEDAMVQSKLLHAAYENWCEENGLNTVSMKLFGSRLNDMGIETRRSGVGNYRIKIRVR